jgi:uncharacterized tellurite resistance protein B-like protein
MALTDRIAPLCDLLLGAAYADLELKDAEDEAVRRMLTDLSGAELTTELEHQLASFDPATFDLATTAAAFKADSADDRRRLLNLAAAIHDADEEIDFAEDEYLCALCAALELPPSALDGLKLEYEVEDLRADFAKVRRGPPPLPGKRDGSVDIDL